MRVVVLRPEGQPEEMNLPDSGDLLHQLQTLVGGWIEVAMRMTSRNVVVYCNEEGHLLGLPPNIIRPTDGHVLVGTLVAVKVSGDTEVSMNELEAYRVTQILGQMTASRQRLLTDPKNDLTS